MRRWLVGALVACAFVVNVQGNSCLSGSSSRCIPGTKLVDLQNCMISQADVSDLEACFDTIGRSGIQFIYLNSNDLTAISADLFQGMWAVLKMYLDENSISTIASGAFTDMTSLTLLDLRGNEITSLETGTFNGLTSVEELDLSDNMLSVLHEDAFAGLTTLVLMYLTNNMLTTLHADTFQDLGSGDGGTLFSVDLQGNTDLQCIPEIVFYDWDIRYSSYTQGDYIDMYKELPPTSGLCDCDPAAAVTCADVTTCVPGAKGFTCDGVGVDDVSGDPHMRGLRGQTINWSGVDGGWYSLISDQASDLHVNVRLTAPLRDEFPNRQLITGLGITCEGHSLVVEVKNPYNTTTGGCPQGISPCLANGGLSAMIDGREVDDLLHFSREVPVGDNTIVMSASNLPVECRQFGGDKIWARMYQEMLHENRVLNTRATFEDWILSFGNMAAPEWCAKYVAENNLADLQSTHAIFKVLTSAAITVRLNAGVNFQGDGELDWDGRILPDLEFWQMDVGFDGLDIDNPMLSGILGETARPVYDATGREVMEGFEAFRGDVEDYRVSDALGTRFALVEKMGNSGM